MATLAAPPPEETQQQAPPAQQQDFGQLFENLPPDKIEQLRQVKLACDNRDQWARMVEIIRVTLRRYFDLGIQHGFWNADTQQFQVGPAGGSYTGGENLSNEDLFSEDFNIFTQNGKIFMSVFSQNADTSRMEPDKPLDPASVAAADEAEKYLRVYQKYNAPKDSQLAVGKLLWTDGRVIAWTDHSSNGEIFGYEDDGTGKLVARAGEWTRYFGVLETKVPILETEFAKWPYCKVSIDRDIFTAKQDNPKFAKDIQKGKSQVANDEIARFSRISTSENISQISSDTIANIVTEDYYWLRPAAFQALDDADRAFWVGDDSDPNAPVDGIFPNGCRVKFIGSVYCGASKVSMDEEIRCMHALPGSGNSRPSLSDPMVPIQMEFNDAMNMFSELLHKCIPRLWIDADETEAQAISEQISKFGEFGVKERSQGDALASDFFMEPQIEMAQGFDKWLENLQGPLAQFVTGNSPALFGQQMEDQKTAHGYAQARDMSLGLLSIVWTPYTKFASAIRGQAAKKAAMRDEKISAFFDADNDEGEVLSVDPVKMRGGFVCSAVTDQNFPESWTERSNTWKGLLAAATANPAIAEDLQLPDNKRNLVDALGLSGEYVTKGADGSKLQMSEWSQMQQGGGPLQDQQATLQRDQANQAKQAQAAQVLGASPDQLPPLPQQAPVMRSTVPINPDTDDHVAHYQELIRILNSSEGQKIKKDTPEVWQDGLLHLLDHKQYMQQNGIPIPLQSGMAAPPMNPGMPGAVPPPIGGPPVVPGAPPVIPPAI